MQRGQWQVQAHYPWERHYGRAWNTTFSTDNRAQARHYAQLARGTFNAQGGARYRIRWHYRG